MAWIPESKIVLDSLTLGKKSPNFTCFHGGDELLIMQIVVQKRKGITPHSLLMKGALYFTLVRGVKRLAAHLPSPSCENDAFKASRHNLRLGCTIP